MQGNVRHVASFNSCRYYKWLLLSPVFLPVMAVVSSKLVCTSFLPVHIQEVYVTPEEKKYCFNLTKRGL